MEPVTHSLRLDGEDRLVSGDPALLAINARAGGAIGAPLAIPPLATVARLARRLGILVSRAITFADGDVDVDCWVKARPDEAGTIVNVLDRRERDPAPALIRARAPMPPAGADWTWETDAELRLRSISADAAVRFGVSIAAALGRPLTRLFVLEHGDDGALPLLDALTTRTDFAGQHATRRDDGGRVILSGHARLDAAGGFAGFIGGTFAAETDGAPPAPAPAEAPAMVRHLDRALRAPLARIASQADSIHDGEDGPVAAHYADYAADIASAARHLMGLLDDLADLEAIERDDFAVAADPIDLADVARRAAGLLSVRAADAGVSIDRPGAEVRAPATGEFRRTLQVLVNLLANAVQHSPRGAAIAVSVETSADRAVAIVADQGAGIAAADQARIFDKFERLSPGGGEGSGLGLYIARRLARAMGGDLTVESAPGAGARFRFTLPAG